QAKPLIERRTIEQAHPPAKFGAEAFQQRCTARARHVQRRRKAWRESPHDSTSYASRGALDSRSIEIASHGCEVTDLLSFVRRQICDYESSRQRQVALVAG